MSLPVGRSGTASFLRLLREVLENAAVASTVSRQNSTSANSNSQPTASAGSCSSSSTRTSTNSSSPNGLSTSSNSTSCACSLSSPGASSSSSLRGSTSSHPPFARLHTNGQLNSPRGASAVKAPLPNSSSPRSDPNHQSMHMLAVASGHAHSHNGFHVSSSGAAASTALPPSRFASFQNDFQRHQIRRKWVFGDDACFIAHHKLADVIGVADGVGGWRSYGIDPSRFSSTLMNTCARLVQEGRVAAAQPADVLAAAYYEILDSKAALIGSCTACIVSFNRADRTLYSATLGDSGFLVLRATLAGPGPGLNASHMERVTLEAQPVLRVVHRSRKMQHYFNAPHQLAVEPAEQRGLVLSDSPAAAAREAVSVCEGDIILVATDGLFDNLHESAIIELCAPLLCSHSQSALQRELQRVADALVRRALELSEDPAYVSPFALEAREHGLDALGGKPDDITLLLAKVRVEEACASGARASAAAADAASTSAAACSLLRERSTAVNMNLNSSAAVSELSSSAASFASASGSGSGSSVASVSRTMPMALPSRASASAADSVSDTGFGLGVRARFSHSHSHSESDSGEPLALALALASAPSAAASACLSFSPTAQLVSASASSSGCTFQREPSTVPKQPEPALVAEAAAAVAASASAAVSLSGSSEPLAACNSSQLATDAAATRTLRTSGSAPMLFVLDEDYSHSPPSLQHTSFGPF